MCNEYTYERSSKAQLDEFSIKQLVVEGDKTLNIGRYADAKRIFEEELEINPQNTAAAWGLKKAEARATLSGEAIKQAAFLMIIRNQRFGNQKLDSIIFIQLLQML